MLNCINIYQNKLLDNLVINETFDKECLSPRSIKEKNGEEY